MPYISKEKRHELIWSIGELANNIETYGDLNYCISKLLDLLDAKNYDEHNSIMGVLESAKLEYYRRKVAPYEDKKIKENGDI